MSRRPLSPEEAALWKRLAATVEPLHKTPPKAMVRETPPRLSGGRPTRCASHKPFAIGSAVKPGRDNIVTAPPPDLTRTLDGGWDRRLAKGLVQPDVTVDLHGYTMTGAYDRLDHALALGQAAGHRVMLLITGKARPVGSQRGFIRAAVADWLAASRHSANIAAVRPAHIRHGGSGALYIVLRRRR